MDRKSKRTVISIQEQPQLDFEEAAHSPFFTLPEYQRELLGPRIVAGITDFGIVALAYCIFVLVTFLEMPSPVQMDRRVLGIYTVGFFVLVTVYYFLFMLSSSQTPGMKRNRLIVVTSQGSRLDLNSACLRGFGYLISILPVMLGFAWALIDPEHLTWTDKVSDTYIKKI